MKFTSLLLVVSKYIIRAILTFIVFFFASVILSGVIESTIPETWINFVQDYGNFMQGSEGYYDAWDLIAFVITLPATMLITWLTFRFSGYLPFLRP